MAHFCNLKKLSKLVLQVFPQFKILYSLYKVRLEYNIMSIIYIEAHDASFW